MKIPFIEDPKSGQQSVSLTVLILSTLVVLVAFGLNIAGVVDSTSISLEFFAISASLYFGRNMGINGRTYTASTPVVAVVEEPKVDTK